jgi:RNA polymerase sigma-B factor
MKNVTERAWSRHSGRSSVLRYQKIPLQLLILIRSTPIQIAAFRIAWCNAIAQRHIGLARKVAHEFEHDSPEPYKDLEQIAFMGLLRAAYRYNPKQGAAFSSFAMPFARGEVQHWLRDHWGVAPKIPRRCLEIVDEVRKVQRSLSEEQIASRIALGLQCDETTIARGLNHDGSKWQFAVEATHRKPLKSVEDIQIAVEPNEPTEDLSYVRAALARLPQPDRAVVSAKFFQGLSEAQIAKQNNLTLAQVQIALESGKQRLRKRLEGFEQCQRQQ